MKRIHFVGIKGVGMAPLAIIAKEAGFAVTGSDIAEEFITDTILQKAGIVPQIGFDATHVGNVDLLITTGAHGGFDNIETKTARQRNIPVLTQGEAVGYFMKGDIFGRKFQGVSVAGCHGKTTTTAMIATILKNNNLDPSFVIGTSDIPSLGSSGHYGKGNFFVAEADEYATEPVYDKTPKLLWQHPEIAVFTNIEFDHPDLFPTVAHVRNTFLEFANRLPDTGTLVLCGDDAENSNLIKEYAKRYITYGFSPKNDYVAENVRSQDLQMFFWVKNKDTVLGEFVLQVAGEHNVLNALGAAVTALELGLSIEQIQKGLKAFGGTKRRFEYKGKLVTGALVYDDYAHHPTEIKSTLKAFRRSFPGKRIVCVFQPHTYSRTKSLFDEFSNAFQEADTVILTDIYPSLREEPDPTISSEKLAMSIKNVQKDVLYLPQLADVVKYVDQNLLDSNTIFITMGAGDVYKIADVLHTQP